MKFETVLYAVAFFLLALISLPDEKSDKMESVSQIEKQEAPRLAATDGEPLESDANGELPQDTSEKIDNIAAQDDQ